MGTTPLAETACGLLALVGVADGLDDLLGPSRLRDRVNLRFPLEVWHMEKTDPKRTQQELTA